MEKHISLVAVLHIGFSILGLMIGAIAIIILVSTGIVSQDSEAFLVLTIVGISLAIFMFITCIPGLIGGIGLLKKKNWARLLLLIISAIDLLNVPLGTALGAYSLWVLVQEKTIEQFNT